MTPRSITFISSGRGSGKTTACANLAVQLAHMELRVPVVDLDPWAHATHWLEVDRGTERGLTLLDKLARYYRHAQRSWPWNRNVLRLLILVEHNDEPHLAHLCRRLQRLYQHHGTTLDVRLTRADLLAARVGMDPTLRKWRILNDNTFVPAFDQPPRLEATHHA